MWKGRRENGVDDIVVARGRGVVNENSGGVLFVKELRDT